MNTSPVVVLTGFEPFAGDQSNPSGEVVRRLADEWDGPEALVTDVLPVAFDAAAHRMRDLIATHDPDVVIATGLAGGRRAVSLERVAVNLIDARIPDAHGDQPVDVASVATGPAAVFSTLPVKATVQAIEAAGIPAELSLTAGSYVCNHVFFVAAHTVRPESRVGFIHLPWTRDHTDNAPDLSTADLVRALRIAIRCAVDLDEDIHPPGGAIH